MKTKQQMQTYDFPFSS